jgi:hypothetical protein
LGLGKRATFTVLGDGEVRNMGHIEKDMVIGAGGEVDLLDAWHKRWTLGLGLESGNGVFG